MNQTQKDKVIRFLDDSVMSDSVYELLLGSFLKDRGVRDVNVLAAERLAVDFLNRAWKDMSVVRGSVSEEEKNGNNPGV